MHLLQGLLDNTSEVQPEIIHTDTHAAEIQAIAAKLAARNAGADHPQIQVAGGEAGADSRTHDLRRRERSPALGQAMGFPPSPATVPKTARTA